MLMRKSLGQQQSVLEDDKGEGGSQAATNPIKV